MMAFARAVTTMKYLIPSNKHHDAYFKDHFDLLNQRDASLSDRQKECGSELTAICKKYEKFTDKGPTGPYYIKHNYTEIYGDLLRYYKDKKINFLEIGVRKGGSLLMWRDYFRLGFIYGIDTDLGSIQANLKVDRIKVFKGNAYSEDTINRFFKDIKFDVILDDGSHRLKDQQKFLNLYSPLLREGGMLIIEDIVPKNAPQIIESFEGPINKCSLIDRRHCIPSTGGELNIIYYK